MNDFILTKEDVEFLASIGVTALPMKEEGIEDIVSAIEDATGEKIAEE